MRDHAEAVAVVLDAYQHQILPDDIPSHRADPLLAQLLVQSLIEGLARHADRHHLDIDGTLAELHQQRIDRGGAETDTVCNFRLGAEIQFREQVTATGASPRYPRWRGFITALTASPTGDAECSVRVPGIAERLHVNASELEPADPLLPIATRTAGVVSHAGDAEETIIHIAARLQRAAHNDLVADQQALADLAQLSTGLAKWSGGRHEQLVHQLHGRIQEAAVQPGDPATTPPSAGPPARLAATAFPDGLTPSPPADPPETSKVKPRDQPKNRKRRR